MASLTSRAAPGVIGRDDQPFKRCHWRVHRKRKTHFLQAAFIISGLAIISATMAAIWLAENRIP
jgi:hypothetical protein